MPGVCEQKVPDGTRIHDLDHGPATFWAGPDMRGQVLTRSLYENVDFGSLITFI